MQQAIPYRTWVPPSAAAASPTTTTAAADSLPQTSHIKIGTSVQKLVAENAVIVFGRRGCCMCHVVKRLLLGLGVNPPVVEVDEEEEAAVMEEFSRIHGGDDGKGAQFPVIFVGGKLFGGLERVMGTHISGELVPILKDAGALWL
ncbi:hypothetical protein ACSBR2_015655 [Camellia fascicularis]